MDNTSKTQISVAVIGVVGTIAVALIANWSNIFGPERGDHQATVSGSASASAATSSEGSGSSKSSGGGSGNSGASTSSSGAKNSAAVEYSRTCKYTAGLKAGTIQYFPPNIPIIPARVGDPCNDGAGSYGFAIEDQ
jgi:hypothetical protein